MLIPAKANPEIGKPGGDVVRDDSIGDFEPAVLEEVRAFGWGEVGVGLGHDWVEEGYCGLNERGIEARLLAVLRDDRGGALRAMMAIWSTVQHSRRRCTPENRGDCGG